MAIGKNPAHKAQEFDVHNRKNSYWGAGSTVMEWGAFVQQFSSRIDQMEDLLTKSNTIRPGSRPALSSAFFACISKINMSKHSLHCLSRLTF